MTSSLLLGKARPNLWRQDPNIRNYCDILERILRDLPDLSSSSSEESVVSLLSSQIAALEALISDLQNRLDSVALSGPVIRDISISGGSYDLAPFDDVTATRGAVLTLPANPSPDEEITVRNGDGSNITIKGNGKQIFYRLNKNNIKTVNKGSILTFRYKIDIDKWVL